MEDIIEKQLLGNDLSWNAKFHSFDQRNSEVYFVLTIYKLVNDEYLPVNKFGVSTYEYYNRDVDEKVYYIDQLTTIAKEGKTNISPEILWKGLGQDHIDKF
jgi:hypothetical protein